MTKAQVKAAVKKLGLSATWKADWNEWRIAIPGKGNEASAYYTDDDEDAVGSAKMMAQQLKEAKTNPGRKWELAVTIYRKAYRLWLRDKGASNMAKVKKAWKSAREGGVKATWMWDITDLVRRTGVDDRHFGRPNLVGVFSQRKIMTTAQMDEVSGVVKSLKANPALGHGGRLGAKDKRVIAAFAKKKPCEGHKLWTDGTYLDGHWMGGNGIARWEGGKVYFTDLGSKAAAFVQKAIVKAVPKNRQGGFIAKYHARNPGKGKRSVASKTRAAVKAEIGIYTRAAQARANRIRRIERQAKSNPRRGVTPAMVADRKRLLTALKPYSGKKGHRLERMYWHLAMGLDENATQYKVLLVNARIMLKEEGVKVAPNPKKRKALKKRKTATKKKKGAAKKKKAATKRRK